jgi:hypothetical protein
MTKTYYDITIISNSDEEITIKGIGHTALNSVTYNDSVKSVVIDKQYEKKTR